MTEPTLLRGTDLAAGVRESVRADLDILQNHDATPKLATVLMSEDPADVAFMDRKHEVCAEFGVPTERVDLPPDAPPSECYDAVERLGAAEDVTALFVQVPLPDHVEAHEIRARVPVAKDVDCFAFENGGRLVAGNPRLTPPTATAVQRLLAAHDVPTAGQDVVVVGRSDAIGKPLANVLLHRGPGGDATVTVCHTATRNLAAKTRDADILVTTAGVPRLVDAAMVADGVTVVDVSVNRVAGESDETEHELVGDVDFESVREKAAAITPVPGGVGPLTLALVLRNVVDVTARQAGVEAALSGD